MAKPSGHLGADLLSVVARLNRWATRHASLAVPPAQARLLAQIEELGSARIGDLARADHCSQPTMTTQVQRLERAGWVQRVGDPVDRRAVLISLTPLGSRLLAELRQARADVVQPVVDRLSAEERLRLADAVDVLNVLLRAAPARD
jgi:DNA-binding MarR family transcriptional regulator